MSTSGISFAGSSIDVQGMVNSLMALEQRPLQSIQAKQSSTNVTISALSELKSRTDATYVAANAVQSGLLLSGRTATSSDSEVASVAVTTPQLAGISSYELSVSRLASSQRSTFMGFNSSTEVFGAGTGGTNSLTISIPASSSMSDDGLAITKSFDIAGQSLAQIRAAINEDDDLAGRVSASVVNTNGPAGWVLVLTGAKTGDDAVFEATWTSEPSVTEELTAVKTIGGFTSATSQGTIVTPHNATASNSLQISIDANSSLSGGTAINVSIPLIDPTDSSKMRSLTQIKDAINSDASINDKLVAHVINQGGAQGWALVLRSVNASADATFGVNWDVDPEVEDQLTASRGALAVNHSPIAGLTDERDASYTNDTTDVDYFLRGGAKRALDAQAVLNGLTVESASNSFKDAIAGVSFEVKKPGSSTTIQVNDNRDAVKQKVSAFASAISDLLVKLRDLTKPGTEQTRAGPLASNSGALSMQSSILSSFMRGFTLTGEPGVRKNWSLLGLEVQRDGSITVNTSTLDDYLAGSGGALLARGFESNAVLSTLNAFRGVEGTLQGTIATMRSELSSLEKRRDDMVARLDRTRTMMLKKYAALDAQLSKMNQLRSNIGASLSAVA